MEPWGCGEGEEGGRTGSGEDMEQGDKGRNGMQECSIAVRRTQRKCHWQRTCLSARKREQDLSPLPALRSTTHLSRQWQQRQHAEAHHQQQREGD